MAELSGEPSWVDAFNNDWDVHSVGAEMMYKARWSSCTEDGCAYALEHKKCGCKGHKALRNKCKATNFKVAYGGEDLSNDLGISKEESRETLGTWRKSVPVLAKYLSDSGKSATQKFESRTFSGRRRLFTPPTWESAKEKAIERAKDDGKDPSLVGSTQVSRAYYTMFGNIERQGKNTPIQGGNADIAKVTMGCGYDKNGQPFMWHRLWSEFQAELVMFVHDEAVVECPEENAAACKEWIQDCIKRAGAEFMTKVTMESEGKISDRWEK
jgi:DNA polymerase I-like protein with 3'-5' exonuclease and polymerase domains